MYNILVLILKISILLQVQVVKILYIHRTYHGTVAEIASMRPRQVILAENIPNGRRLDLMRGLYRLNLPVHDLSISPIRLPITEAQPENSGEE